MSYPSSEPSQGDGCNVELQLMFSMQKKKKRKKKISLNYPQYPLLSKALLKVATDENYKQLCCRLRQNIKSKNLRICKTPMSTEFG